MTQLSLSSLNDTVELQGTLERVVFHNEENGYTVFRVRPEGKDEVDLVTVVGHMGSPQAGPAHQGPVGEQRPLRQAGADGFL